MLQRLRHYLHHYQGLSLITWQGLVLTVLNALCIGVCFFLSLYFVNSLHYSVTQAGMLMSLYGLGTIVGGLLGGKLCDRYAPKKIACISALFQSIAFLFLANTISFPLLLANLFLLGLATYSFKTANQVWLLAQQSHQALRLKVISLNHVATNVGLGIAGLFMGLGMATGFSLIFYFSSAVLLFSSAYLLCHSESTPKSLADTSIGLPETTDKSPQFSRFIRMLVCVFLIGLVISQLGSTYPIYVENAFPQLGAKAVSILFLLDTFLIVFCQAPLIHYLHHRNHQHIAGLGGFLMGAGMLVLSVPGPFIIGIVSCLIWTTGEMLFVAMAQSVCYETGITQKKGQTQGAFQAVFAASAVMGPLLGGYIYDHSHPNTVWYISFVLGIICLFLCYFPIATHPRTKGASDAKMAPDFL